MNAICHLFQAPVRSEPSDKSEMVTQLLFGETLTILEEKGNWLRISMHFDNYEGWIDRKQSKLLNDDFSEHIAVSTQFRLVDKINQVTDISTGNAFLIGKGSKLPLTEGQKFRINEINYKCEGHIVEIPKKFIPEQVLQTAFDYLNTPYLWGGRSITGIDCSGLAQMVYLLNGVALPRDAAKQALEGTAIDFTEEAIPGDLAFFDNEAGAIIHVGIIAGSGQILHASGNVKIDKLDHHGIYNSETASYTHKLRIIKRFR